MDLLSAISNGRTDLIVDYIEEGGSARGQSDQGQSLISIAAYYGDVSAIKYLTHHNVKIEELGDNYDLNGAVFHGHWQLSQYLLEQGADPNWPLEGTGETPLHSCISKANNPRTIHIIRILLAHGANPNVHTIPNQKTGGFMRDAFTYSETPLHRAAAFGTLDMIQALLDGGADRASKDMNGATPLSWASWHLRPGKILARLTYGEHTVHPLHEKYMLSDHGGGYGAGTMHGLLGKPHLG